MPPLTGQVKLSGEDVGMILAKLREFDGRFDSVEKRFDAQDKELACLQDGINGTVQKIGIAGDVRNLKDWRGEIEKEVPLVIQLKDLVDWQRAINRVLLFVGTPLFGIVLVGILTLLWGMLTNHIDINVH